MDNESLYKRWEFLLQQYADAMHPENFLHTNPELLKTTLNMQGENLLAGWQNFLDDAQNFFTNTDIKAFAPGKNIACTDGRVIYKNRLLELIAYQPITPYVYEIPLLIVPAWINKFYILDLQPHNSLVNWLVQQGVMVYMISWINPDASYRDTAMQDYLAALDDAISKIYARNKSRKLNLAGFCAGGTLAAMLLADNQHPKINSLTLMATMIDFSNPGELGTFIDEPQVTAIEYLMQHQGYFPAPLMSMVFNLLRSRDLIWANYNKRYLKGLPHEPFDILYWNADSTNIPARMHQEYLRQLYLENRLINTINNITTPTFFIAAEKDHIVPWESVFQGMQYFSCKKRFILCESGHIAGIINPPAAGKYGFYKNNKYKTDSIKWKQEAGYYNGSWWPEWFKWLPSGKSVPATVLANHLPKAPGSYVKARWTYSP